RWIRPVGASLAAGGIMGLGVAFSPHLYWLILGPAVYGISLYLLGGIGPEDMAVFKSVLPFFKTPGRRSEG
ncbi:MAG TPA: hypothetical protein VJ873_08420, partial [bacterium]|nr:hypothetical protein [bacterium]